MVSSYAAFGIVFMFFWGIYYLCYNKIIKEEDLICSDYIKSFLQSARPNLRYILHSFSCRSPATPPSFRRNLPQIVTYILQKAFFKHALVAKII